MKITNSRSLLLINIITIFLIIPISGFTQTRDYNTNFNPYISSSENAAGLTDTMGGDYLAVNALAAGSAASMGLRFGLAGILSADVEYSSMDNTISSSFLELSTIPLYSFNAKEAFYSNVLSGVLMAGEVLSSELLGPNEALTEYVGKGKWNSHTFGK